MGFAIRFSGSVVEGLLERADAHGEVAPGLAGAAVLATTVEDRG
jgi:hypothetical protein